MVDHYSITFIIKTPKVDPKILQKLNKIKAEMERVFDYEYSYTEYINEANSRQVTKSLQTMKLKQNLTFTVDENESIQITAYNGIKLENIKQIEKMLDMLAYDVEIKHRDKDTLVVSFRSKKEYDSYLEHKKEIKK